MTDNGSTPYDVERVRRRISDLRQFAEEAATVSSFGLESYVADTPHGALLRNAGSHVIVKVATVVEKLPAPFKEARPEIPWTSIGRMRNLIAHHHDRVNDDLVFETLHTRIPEILARLGDEGRPDVARP